ncbi:MAG: hypothetical protein IT370_30605 [Deltaproteobacteria bacterium]|nr:hypothetical protein [Deltaproteobacteria bacterium]
MVDTTGGRFATRWVGLALLGVLAGCGGGGGGDAQDAAPGGDGAPVDAAAPPDAAITPDGAELDAAPPDAAPLDAPPADVAIDAMPTGGETCALATSFGPGTYPGQTTVGANNDYTGSLSANGCTGSDDGRDLVYSVTVPPNKRLIASVTPTGAYDPSIYLVGTPAAACGAMPRLCLASDDSGGAAQTNTVRYINNGASDQTVYVIVDTGNPSDPGGVFTLTIALDDLPAGDLCDTAPVTALSNLSAQSTDGFAPHYNFSASSCVAATGPDRVYQLTLPAGQRVVATAMPVGGFDVALNVVEATAPTACNATPSCVTSANAGVTGVPETVTLVNESGSPRDVFLIVDSVGTVGGTFDLSLQSSSPTLGDICGSASPLAGAGTTSGQTTVGFVDDYTACDASTRGLDRVYSIGVPAGQRLEARITPGPSFNSAAYLVAAPASSCSASSRACLGLRQEAGAGLVDSASWTNATGSAQTVFVVADSTSAATGGGFDLVTTLSTPITGDTCLTAPLLTGSTTLTGETLTGFVNDYKPSTLAVNCGFGSGGQGADRVYAVAVAPGKRLRATVQPTGFDTSLQLVRGGPAACELTALTCTAAVDANFSTGGPETITWANATATSETLYLVVDSRSGTGSYDLTLTVEDVLAGDTCSPPEALPPTGSAISMSTSEDDFRTATTSIGCGNSTSDSTGRDRVFAVTVPAGERFSAQVRRSSGNGRPALFLVPVGGCGPPAPSCRAFGASSFSTEGAYLTYTNSGAASEQLLLVVDGITDLTTQIALDWQFGIPATGDVCASPTALAVPSTITGTTLGSVNDYAGACDLAAGPDQAYALSAGARTLVEVAMSAPFAGQLALVAPPASCDNGARSCVAPYAGAFGQTTVRHYNSSAAAQSLHLIVDSDQAGGQYALTSKATVLSAMTEVEPNDLFGMATPISGIGTMATGSIETASANDTYSFTLTSAADIAIETFDGDATRLDCVGTDTAIQLLAADGVTVLATDDESGINSCGMLDPVANGLVGNLQPATYYVRVSSPAAGTAYRLMVRQVAQCGNAVTEGREQCDDGNMNEADGCTMGCRINTFLDETEPNDDGSVMVGGGTQGNDFSSSMTNGPISAPLVIRGGLTPAGDEDVYVLANTTASPRLVRLDSSVDANGACPSGTDTYLHLRNAAGQSLAFDDDGGEGQCSSLTYSIPAMTSVYLHFFEYQDDAPVPAYQILVRFP